MIPLVRTLCCVLWSRHQLWIVSCNGWAHQQEFKTTPQHEVSVDPSYLFWSMVSIGHLTLRRIQFRSQAWFWESRSKGNKNIQVPPPAGCGYEVLFHKTTSLSKLSPNHKLLVWEQSFLLETLPDKHWWSRWWLIVFMETSSLQLSNSDLWGV